MNLSSANKNVIKWIAYVCTIRVYISIDVCVCACVSPFSPSVILFTYENLLFLLRFLLLFQLDYSVLFTFFIIVSQFHILTNIISVRLSLPVGVNDIFHSDEFEINTKWQNNLCPPYTSVFEVGTVTTSIVL